MRMHMHMHMQVKLGVDEKAGDGGESARLVAEFGDGTVAAVANPTPSLSGRAVFLPRGSCLLAYCVAPCS